jgi:hypothetical protein
MRWVLPLFPLTLRPLSPDLTGPVYSPSFRGLICVPFYILPDIVLACEIQ